MVMKISVVITNYNRENFLARAIRSCLEQILFINKNIEIIVVDDASTDNSMNILRMFGDDIKFIRHEENMGVACASNTGFKLSTGDFIIRLDADDFLNKLNLHLLSEILINNHDYGYAYSDHYRVDDLGFKESYVSLGDYETLLNHGAGVMFRREVVQSVGLYDEALRNCEDYDYLIRVSRLFKGYHLPLPLYRYHIHGQNISADPNRDHFKMLVRGRHGI